MNVLELIANKCYKKVGNDVKRAYHCDLTIDGNKRVFYTTEDWDIIAAREGYVNGLISPEYMKLREQIDFGSEWAKDLPVY